MTTATVSSSQPDVQELVRKSFQKGTPKVYWHHLALNYKGAYDSNTITARVKEIASQLGENSFQSQADYGWTPLHVAAIVGNVSAIQFLVGQNVRFDQKDQFGKIPIEYVQQFHPDLLHCFTTPHRVTNKMEFLKPVFEKWKVKLPPLKEKYRANTEDFGREITRLFIAKPISQNLHFKCSNVRILQNLTQICQRLGITTKSSKEDHYVRDLWFRAPSGKLFKTFLCLQHEKALDRAESHALYFNKKAHTRTKNPFFKNCTGGTFLHIRESGDLSKKELDEKEATEAFFQFEGGNVVTFTTPDGKVKAGIGRDHRLITLNSHRLDKKLFGMTDPLMQPFVERVKTGLTPQKIRKVAEYLYIQGTLKQNERTGVLTFSQRDKVAQQEMELKDYRSSSDPVEHPFREIVTKLGLVVPFKWNEKVDVESCKGIVAKYQVQKYTLHKMTASNFEIEPEDLFYISQAAYHVDYFTRPGPNHSMMHQNYLMCAEVLSAILTNADSLGLSEDDKQHLRNYIVTAQKLHAELGPLHEKVNKEMGKVKVPVVPMPGCFMYESDKQALNVNFINWLSGWSSTTKNYFLITNGCQVGERLGVVLMDMFHLFMEQYVQDIEIYYTGHPIENRSDFSEPQLWTQNPEGQAGVHCFTFETGTKDH